MRSGDRSLPDLEAALYALARRVRTNKELAETPRANDSAPRYVSRR